MWRGRALRESNGGYTVTELTLVLSVGLTLLMIAVPMVDFLINQYNLTLSAEAIATQLQFARMRAVSSNQASRLRFPDANTYRVETEDGNVTFGTPKITMSGHSIIGVNSDDLIVARQLLPIRQLGLREITSRTDP